MAKYQVEIMHTWLLYIYIYNYNYFNLFLIFNFDDIMMDIVLV